MRRSDDALATLALVSRLRAQRVQPLKASEYWQLSAGLSCGPASLLGMDAEEMSATHDISARLAMRVAALLGRATALAFDLERLEHSGIRTLTPFDDHYPSAWVNRLGSKAPPMLYAAGSIELLDRPSLGVVGSRDVSPSGAEVAAAAGRFAAAAGLPLVSGGARGVDRFAMDAAADAGGAVIGILATALSDELRNPAVRAAIHEERTVMCTPYNPDAEFSAGNAMGRNKLIYAHAALTLVVACVEGSGGTWTGATEALDHGYGRVAVWRVEGEGAGNASLERHGAVPITTVADLTNLLSNPKPLGALATLGPVPAPKPAAGQGSLFDAP